jgi:hypothetical protein
MRSPRETVAFYAGYFGWRKDAPPAGPVVIGHDEEGPSPRENRLWRRLLGHETAPAGELPGETRPARDDMN